MFMADRRVPLQSQAFISPVTHIQSGYAQLETKNACGNMNICLFIYGLFSSDYTGPNDEMMNHKLERMGKEVVVS
jgi:hypothetical protein